MDDHVTQLTDLISAEIKKQYKSDRQFAQAMNIPPTTLSSILKNGVKGTAYSTVMDICMALGIRLIYDNGPRYLDKRAYDVLNEYQSLDEPGQQVTKGVIKREKERMKNEEERQTLIEYGTEPADTRSAHEKIAEIRKTINYTNEN